MLIHFISIFAGETSLPFNACVYYIIFFSDSQPFLFGSGVGFCKRRLKSHTHRQQTKNTSSRQSGGKRRIGTTCGGRVLNTLCSPARQQQIKQPQ